LASDDGDYLSGRADKTTPPLSLVVDGTAPTGEVLGVSFDLVAKANTVGLTQTIELWDWNAGAYVVLGSQSSTMSDSLQSVSAGGVLSRFVQSGTRAVRARVTWAQTGPVMVWPWAASVDQAVWRVRVR
jgi:hypothetical protein